MSIKWPWAIALISMIGLLESTTTIHAQNQWGELPKGSYAVGYKDTTLLRDYETYKFYDYEGGKCFLVSIWYPAKDNARTAQMKYQEYFDFSPPSSYQRVCDTLMYKYKQSLLYDGICLNINLEAEKPILDSTHYQILEQILAMPVAAKRGLVAAGNKYPCIFYHHGAQSFPFDNNTLAEYLASWGFVVVSANYQFPKEGFEYLTVPGDYQFDQVADMAFVWDKIRQMPLIDSNKVVSVGHSWGGQTMLAFDNERTEKPFKVNIIFDTTMEAKDTTFARKGWPRLSYLLDNRCQLATTPTIIIAPSRTITKNENNQVVLAGLQAPLYSPFRLNTTTPYTFSTVRHFVKHDGFLSLGNIRFTQLNRFKFVDEENIKLQQGFYEKIILYTHLNICKYLAYPLPSHLDQSIEQYFEIIKQNQKE